MTVDFLSYVASIQMDDLRINRRLCNDRASYNVVKDKFIIYKASRHGNTVTGFSTLRMTIM